MVGIFSVIYCVLLHFKKLAYRPLFTSMCENVCVINPDNCISFNDNYHPTCAVYISVFVSSKKAKQESTFPTCSRLEKVKAAQCGRTTERDGAGSQGSILIWPRTAADCGDNGAVELHYTAVVWLIPDCSLSGAFTSLITFCLLLLNPDQLSLSKV